MAVLRKSKASHLPIGKLFLFNIYLFKKNIDKFSCMVYYYTIQENLHLPYLRGGII